MPLKHKIIFASGPVKVLVNEEKDKYLAKASLENLRSFLPDFDNRNVDLLPFSCSAYVVNASNLNHAAVETTEAVESAELFKNKFVNIGHSRNKIVGFITDISFAEFVTEKPLTKEEVSQYKKPFNVITSGYIWRFASEKLADLLEDTNNPLSENYMKLSASFEISFDDFVIAVLPKGKKNLEDAKFITDAQEIAELAPKLKTFGGNGSFDKDNYMVIVVKGAVLPLGIGLTETPAAAVKGIAVLEDEVINEENSEDNKDEDIEENREEETEETAQTTNSNIKIANSLNTVANTIEQNTQLISQLQNLVVKDNNEQKILSNMPKFTSYKEITDEAVKTLTASAIHEVVESELKVASDIWAKEKAEKELSLKDTQAKYEETAKTNAELIKELETIKASLKTLQEEKAVKDTQDKFNARMAHFDEKFELTKEDRQAIASQIKDLDEAKFKEYDQTMQVLLNAKNKEVLAKKKNEIAASTQTNGENINQTVDSLVDTAKQTTAAVPNTTTVEPKTLKERISSWKAEDFAEVSLKRGR